MSRFGQVNPTVRDKQSLCLRCCSKGGKKKCAVEVEGSSWFRTTPGGLSPSLLADVEQGAMAGGSREAARRNQGWGVPGMGNAGCGVWKGIVDLEEL